MLVKFKATNFEGEVYVNPSNVEAILSCNGYAEIRCTSATFTVADEPEEVIARLGLRWIEDMRAPRAEG